MGKRRPMMRRSARMRRTKGLQLVVMLLLFLLIVKSDIKADFFDSFKENDVLYSFSNIRDKF